MSDKPKPVRHPNPDQAVADWQRFLSGQQWDPETETWVDGGYTLRP